jgi:septal ring factor EnvC (AmiA/AmiB activator)
VCLCVGNRDAELRAVREDLAARSQQLEDALSRAASKDTELQQALQQRDSDVSCSTLNARHSMPISRAISG